MAKIVKENGHPLIVVTSYETSPSSYRMQSVAIPPSTEGYGLQSEDAIGMYNSDSGTHNYGTVAFALTSSETLP